jgi:hypothetical protein
MIDVDGAFPSEETVPSKFLGLTEALTGKLTKSRHLSPIIASQSVKIIYAIGKAGGRFSKT